MNQSRSRRLHLASKLIFGPNIRLLMVRALADVTIESASLDAREALSGNARRRPQRDQAVDPADRDDEPLGGRAIDRSRLSRAGICW
jgi:hypothetical protein